MKTWFSIALGALVAFMFTMMFVCTAHVWIGLLLCLGIAVMVILAMIVGEMSL